ncbi:transmembrane protein 107 [Anabrus simplex]|uniref:transmembrane protein 107 n=1 Tax=Anabrus simplex TaxID=316456 RepID=UPI0035A30DD0
MVFASHGLVPARFLVLIAHLTITITVLWSREENVMACLPVDYTEEDYARKDHQMVVGLSLAVVFIGVELLGFFSGLTMFMTTTAMISIASHTCASILLAHFVLDEWDCNLYWWIFVFCSLIPALTEVVMAASTSILRKG